MDATRVAPRQVGMLFAAQNVKDGPWWSKLDTKGARTHKERVREGHTNTRGGVAKCSWSKGKGTGKGSKTVDLSGRQSTSVCGEVTQGIPRRGEMRGVWGRVGVNSGGLAVFIVED